jgi:hypothetical protein
MGNAQSSSIIKNINFEDLQSAIKDNEKTVIINTLDSNNQKCLIKGTISIDDEVKILNTYITKSTTIHIIIYGTNACDTTIVKKYEQLISLGFYNVFIYPGGLFEWLLLQDIYGDDMFPTTCKEKDILKYKGRQHFNIKLLDY